MSAKGDFSEVNKKKNMAFGQSGLILIYSPGVQRSPWQR